MQPRWYQSEAVEAPFRYWDRDGLPPLASPAIELPTGSGKSAVIGWTAQRLIGMGARVVVATHRAELIEQDAHDMREVWPQAPIGIYSAGLGLKQAHRDVVICGVQTACGTRAIKALGHRDVMIVDEAHLVSTGENTQYGRLIAGLRETSPDMRLVGYTATPYRLGQGYITSGEDALFTSIAYRVGVQRLVDEGYLAPLVSGSASAAIDTAELAVRAGEFVARDLELASNTDEINDAVAHDVAQALGSGRRMALVYATTVAHASMLRNALRMAGVSAEVVDGTMDRAARRAIYRGFIDGEIKALCSCDVITTGFNVKPVDVIALVRPTQSTALYVQILGRGMRTAEGKDNCIVLDYGGNIARHGPVNDVRVKEPRGSSSKDNKAPTKTCPQCYADVPPATRECEHCGYEWPAPERKANKGASALPPMGARPVADEKTWFDVDSVNVFRHEKRGGGLPTVRLDYIGPDTGTRVGPKIASEWLCFEHPEDGFAFRKACDWWRENVATPIPESVDDAVSRLRTKEFPRVTKILVGPDGEFTRVYKVVQERPREPGEDDEEAEEAPPSVSSENAWGDDDLPF